MVGLYIRKMGTSKYRIAYFQQDGLITGSAISLRHFLSAINRNVYEPIIVLANEGPARKLYESLDIKVYVHHFNTFWTFPGPRCFSRGMFNQLKALIANSKLTQFVLNELKPDLIHINDKAALNVGLSLKNTGIPIVQHSRSSYFITTCPMAKYLSSMAIKSYTNHLICISEDEEDGFESFVNKTTIYNTVDFKIVEQALQKKKQTRENLGVLNTEFLIGFAAHVAEKKGAWDFLYLCKQLKQDKNLKFVLVGKLDKTGPTSLGDGKVINISPYEYVQSFITENNLQNQLIVTGFREDNIDLIAAMDLLIVPNKNGVLGRQPIEAQAVGTPVIVTKGHSQKSGIIQDGITGFTVTNINEAITQANEIYQSKNAAKMSLDAQHYAQQKFNPVINMERIEKIYQILIKP